MNKVGSDAHCFDDEGWPDCPACPAYFGDEEQDGNDTDTDYDEELVDQMTSDELYENVGSEPENLDGSQLEYMFMNRSVRHFAHKPSRFQRRPRHAKAKWGRLRLVQGQREGATTLPLLQGLAVPSRWTIVCWRLGQTIRSPPT